MMMNMFTDALKNEQRRIQRLIHLGGDSLDLEERGSLSLETHGTRKYCYELWYKGRKRIRKQYLGKPDSEEVLRHVGARMQQERLRRLQHDQELLSKLEQEYEDYDPASLLKALPASYQTVFEQLQGDHPAAEASRQRLKGSPSDLLLYDWRYDEVKQWAAGSFERNTAPFPKAATYAKDGTRVRSKGECIYYNLLQEHGIPFVYDCYHTFTDQNGETRRICPDFVIRCLDDRLIIIEHLGRLYDMGYSIDAGKKLCWYIHSGYILGKNLFVTSDDVNGGTDSRAILEVVEMVERMFFGY